MNATPPTLVNLVDDWTRARRRLGDRPGTEIAYGWAIGHFLKFAADRSIVCADQVTTEDIEAFQDSLVASGKSRQSQRLASTSLRSLLEYAAAKRLAPAELHLAVARVRVPRGQPRPISEGDLRKLLLYLLPRRPRMTAQVARDRALFLYLLGSSARVSEVLQLTQRDFEQAWVIQKGGGQQMLLSPPIVVEAVKEYLALRTDASEFLWVTFDSNRPVRRITATGVLSIWERLARLVGVPHFTTHQIRHTAASVLLDEGVQESVIAAHLGHSDLTTLANYARTSPRRRQEALTAMQGFLEKTIDRAKPSQVTRSATTGAIGKHVAKGNEPIRADEAAGYLAFLTENLEGQLATLDELTDRLARLLPGPSPSRAVPVLRVLDGEASAPRRSVGSASDDWSDDPAVCEVRARFSPGRGVRFELRGDPIGIVQALAEFGGLFASNPDLPGWLVGEGS